jgi:hypothetical protein
MGTNETNKEKFISEMMGRKYGSMLHVLDVTDQSSELQVGTDGNETTW